ncbi:MAG: hypothetical protein JRJ86_06990 [Deltaproteobacteria bacterium]|nr:hypothetical protein [Deltaproteobacteria bacterium]MBW2116448.1 hypothetical protein [Deltaproteobacteria bacterium]MBW2343061.1 hypothetical protein [Deltaproteobacteria bacterium]
MSVDNTKVDANLDLSDRTAALLMVNKDERKLIRELLVMTLNSENGKRHILNKLGAEYVDLAENLLKALGSPGQPST